MIAIGVFAIRGRQSAERLCVTVTGGMVCLALAANLFVVPALANTLTLEPFTQRGDEHRWNAQCRLHGSAQL